MLVFNYNVSVNCYGNCNLRTTSVLLAVSEAAPWALRERSERPTANRNSTLSLLFLLFAPVPENFVQYLRRFPGTRL